jgi:predicted 3-demethylubiquinone-9 3-methyltransferase (glyoxalase superfamily)
MPITITPFLTYAKGAEDAAKLYTSVFDGKIKNTTHYTKAGPAPEGSVMTVEIELFGQTYTLLNGGEYFSFTDGFSLAVLVDTQAEIDRFTEQLTAGGGELVACGWLKDRFGVSWQITPRALMRLLADPDRAKAARVAQAMMTMKKLDIAELEKAAADK